MVYIYMTCCYVIIYVYIIAEDYEQFAQILFLSPTQRRMETIELPMQSEQGKLQFNNLEVSGLLFFCILYIFNS